MKKTINLKIDMELYQQLLQKTTSEFRSITKTLVMLVKEYVELKEKGE